MADHDVSAQRKRQLIEQGTRLRAQVRQARQEARTGLTPGAVAESLLPQAVNLGLGLLQGRAGVPALLANIERLRPLLPIGATLLSALARNDRLKPVLKTAAIVIAAGGIASGVIKAANLARARQRMHSERDSDFTLLR